jgi:predicted nuclease of restriction endonuclease-like RecB superfamily
MLTAQLVRVRFARDRVIPRYVDPSDDQLLAVAADLIAFYRAGVGRAQSEFAAEFDNLPGDPDMQFVHRGLVKLLEDRCEFGVVAGKPPLEIREAVFARAALARKSPPFDRAAILAELAVELGVTVAEIESGLFADLKSEQRLVSFDDVTPERLLKRYNVALAQGILLKSVRVTIDLRGESPARLRAILRRIKFHRLVCTATATGAQSCRLVLEGPLSLFSATQKYGVTSISILARRR